MATLTHTTVVHKLPRPRVMLWLASASALAALIALLAIAINNNPLPAQDLAVMDWMTGWDLPGLSSFFAVVSFLTSAKAGVVYGPMGIAVLLLLRKTRAALGFAVVGGIIAVVAVLGDYTLGEVVGRTRPPADNPMTSFPSGHVFGSTVLFGFLGFLAIHYRLTKRQLLPLLALLTATILVVGPARIYEQAHYPSDVAAGYLLGALWLLVLIPTFLHIVRATGIASPKPGKDLSVEGSESCRMERSIASVVMLDPQRGTATKVYRPPAVVKMLYWLAFQAKFPYDSNIAALQAATYRRKIAGLLTLHRFGKDLVAPVTEVSCVNDQYSFVTEFVPGEKVSNDATAKRFLAQVTETFAEAGLGVWQINPRNPHAHTNLIRTPQGDLKIIDLESAVVTPLPAPGGWRSALRSGHFPIFDDIDFPRMQRYVSANEVALEASLGLEGMAELKDAMGRGEHALRSWKDGEPRIWGRLARGIYRMLNWQPFFQKIGSVSDGADRAAETFLSNGIERWEREGRLEPTKVQELRTILASREAQDALHHLGAHLVLSVAVVIPIPGMRSLARFAWTLAFWSKAQGRRLFHRTTSPAGKVSNIHSPLVMVLALVPGFGAIAYLAARPLRKKLLVRLMLDQIAWKLPFRLHGRMRLGRWLAPVSRPVLAEANGRAELRCTSTVAAD